MPRMATTPCVTNDAVAPASIVDQNWFVVVDLHSTTTD
jgi:hypothetical protein